MEQLAQQNTKSEDIIMNIAVMAMEFITPEGCRDCKFADMSIKQKSKMAAAGERTVKSVVEEHRAVFNPERCEGKVKPQIQGADGCNPDLECGQKRQPEIIELVQNL